MRNALLTSGLVALTLWGCNGGPGECGPEAPCEGFGETCVRGECVAGACATSAQCPMEHHCDGNECVEGCEFPSDCYPGYTCNLETGACEQDDCFDTAVDCGYREFCNAATGDCFDAGEQYCRFCNEDEECGEGNLCLNHYCGVDCSNGRECPSGFECYPFGDDFGNVVAYQCFTYCWLYEDYEPGEFSGVTPSKPDITVSAERAREAGCFVGEEGP